MELALTTLVRTVLRKTFRQQSEARKNKQNNHKLLEEYFNQLKSWRGPLKVGIIEDFARGRMTREYLTLVEKYEKVMSLLKFCLPHVKGPTPKVDPESPEKVIYVFQNLTSKMNSFVRISAPYRDYSRLLVDKTYLRDLCLLLETPIDSLEYLKMCISQAMSSSANPKRKKKKLSTAGTQSMEYPSEKDSRRDESQMKEKAEATADDGAESKAQLKPSKRKQAETDTIAEAGSHAATAEAELVELESNTITTVETDNRAPEKLAFMEFLSLLKAYLENIVPTVETSQYSYDRLKNALKSGSLKAREILGFFLQCLLYAQDKEVETSEIVEYWIKDNLINENMEDARRKGDEIAEVLKHENLLESDLVGLFIKIPNAIKDFAFEMLLSEIGIGEFFLGANLQQTHPRELGSGSSSTSLDQHTQEEDWEKAKKMFLKGNEVSNLPERPNCHNLTMFSLQENHRLRLIPERFFDSMPSLKVLNLYETEIPSLPSSISHLTNLLQLFLRNCKQLTRLPSGVGELKQLKLLDLRGTDLYELPIETRELKLLGHLEVSFYGPVDPREYSMLQPTLISKKIVSSFGALRNLSIVVSPGDLRWRKNVKWIIEELREINNLTDLCFHFPEEEDLEEFLECPSWKNGVLKRFNFVVGHDVKRMVSRVPLDLEQKYSQQGQCLRFVNGDTKPTDKNHVVVKVLPHAKAFYLDHHIKVKNLLEFGVKAINGLKFCIVSDCPQIETIAIINVEEHFPHLEHLSIHYLLSLRSIWSGQMLTESFAILKYLQVQACPKLKFVLTSSMAQCIPNLEELAVEDCRSVERIITSDDNTIEPKKPLLPKLKILVLNYLRVLVSIWEEYSWPPLESLTIYCCPNLKNLHVSEGELITSTKTIKAEEEWWYNLEWDYYSLSQKLQDRFTPFPKRSFV